MSTPMLQKDNSMQDVVSFTNITDKYRRLKYDGVEYGIAPGVKTHLLKIKANHLASSLVCQILQEDEKNGIVMDERTRIEKAQDLVRQILSIKVKKGFIKEGSSAVIELGADGAAKQVIMDKNNNVLATKNEDDEDDLPFSKAGNLDKTVELGGDDGQSDDENDFEEMSDEELITFAKSKGIEFAEDKTELGKRERKSLINMLQGE